MVRRVPISTAVLALSALPVLFPVPTGARADVAVLVGDFYFSPQNAAISAGETVTWSWIEGFHSTTSGTGPSDPNAGAIWNATGFAGEPPFQHTFLTPGVYPYFCMFHEALGMTGTVTVQGTTSVDPTSWGAIKALFR